MWFATIKGVTRFDGVSYTGFTANNKKSALSLLGSDVWDMSVNDDDLWVLTAYGGLNKINITTCSVTATFPLNDSKGNTLFAKCFSIQKNYAFIGTNEGIVMRFNINRNRIEAQKNIGEEITGNHHIDDIFIDRHSRIWLFLSGNGILITDSVFNKIEFVSCSDLSRDFLSHLQFKGHTTFNNNLLLATTEGLRIISVDDFTAIDASQFSTLLPVIITQHELSAISQRDGEILFSGTDGLYRLNIRKNELDKIIPSKDYEDNTSFTLNDCLYQTDQSIFAGGDGVAWIRNINSPFISFRTSMDGSGIKLDNCFSLYNRGDSSMIVCAADGLYKVNHTSGVIKKFKAKGIYLLAFSDPDDNILASNYTGLEMYNKFDNALDISSIYPELKPLRNDTLITCQKLGDSLFFLAGLSQRGMYIWNIKTKKVELINSTSAKTPLKNNAIKCLYRDSENRIWILCDNAVSIYNPFNKSVQNLDLSVPGSINMDICELNNHFWIACYGTGIVELDNDYKIIKVYSEKDGLSNSNVFKVFALDDSDIIVSSLNGLSILNIHSKKITTYFEDDGLQSDDFDMLSGSRNKKFIFFGGVGFTKVDISKLKKNINPPVFYFLNVKTETKNGLFDTSNLQIKELTIPYDWLQTDISFVGINYLNPKRVTYQYRIKENGSNWISLGTQNFVTLIGLSPGTYSLEVKAANEDGVWCEPKTLSLTFLPKWYQTTWFKAAVILFAGGLFYSFYRYRISQLKKQQQIRREIASDLHDDLGATLNSVKIFTHLAETSPQQQEYFEQIKESVNYAYNRLRDMIWVLDDTGDTVDDLLKRIKQFAQPIANANNIHVHYSADVSNNFILNKTEKRNLLLIAKETINNCIKYADCKNINVTFTRTDGKLKLIMKDDGSGFDAKEIVPGHGLKNIQERAKQIHCVASVYSEKGAGTTIIVTKK